MFSLKLVDNAGDLPLPETPRRAAKFLAATIMNSGYAPGNETKVDWDHLVTALLARDNVTLESVRPLIATTIETVLREPVEPLIQITPLFSRVEVKGVETRVIGGVIGAVHADDVVEGGKYPEVMFQVGSGLQTAYVGKSGIQASFTDEALRSTTWDIMGINLRAMQKALVRHKEQKAVAFLRTLGTSLFDNISPATSVFGVSTGRGLDMAANGSITMDDLFKAMALMTEQGYAPDVLLLNPQMFYLWLQDPILRNMLLAFGGGTYFQKWTGNPGPRDPWSNGQLGPAGPSLGNQVVPVGSPSGETPTGIAGREHGMTSAPTIPPYFPWPLRIVVSPFVPYDSDSGLSDLYLLSSGNVGLLLVDEDPVQVEWRDEDREVTKIKIKERYGFHVSAEGMGVGVLKNIPNKRNYWDGTIQAHTLDVIEEIESDADLSGVL